MIDNDIFVELSEKMGCDLYILPSSIHEVIVVPAFNSVNSEELRDMVRDVNKTAINSEDFLSDSLCLFDRNTFQLQVA